MIIFLNLILTFPVHANDLTQNSIRITPTKPINNIYCYINKTLYNENSWQCFEEIINNEIQDDSRNIEDNDNETNDTNNTKPIINDIVLNIPDEIPPSSYFSFYVENDDDFGFTRAIYKYSDGRIEFVPVNPAGGYVEVEEHRIDRLNYNEKNRTINGSSKIMIWIWTLNCLLLI